jgi:glycosyltransferase involved in cell wall biosynthesis
MVIKKQKLVSILTITQFGRFESLRILFDMIQYQTFKNISEWVIVEGSQTINDAVKNKELIKQFINEINSSINYNINYIEYTGYKLGGLRNVGNKACTGDIIVCFDDDDYYPPTRIEEAVSKLSHSSCLIGGVSDVYLYDFYVDKLFKFKGFLEYHSTNNCMAYKKEYLLLNRHDDDIQIGEERSFTREFTTPLVKFDSRKTIIAISHKNNTFNKRELCLGGVLKTLNTLVEIDEPITNYIDNNIYNKMKTIYYEGDIISPYDIVYLLGYLSNSFHPSDNLHDNDSTIVKLCESFTDKKLKVAIYGEFDLEKDYTYNNVKYIHWKKFPYNEKFNILIYGNSTGLLNGVPFDVSANKIYWDSYESPINNTLLIDLYKKYSSKIDKIFFKSNFHYEESIKYLGNISNYKIILSGIRPINIHNVERYKYRFIYDAPYYNGLEYIISGIFSIIKKLEPRAELHVYGGMDNIKDNDYKNKMIMLFSEHGVTDHGKQPLDIIFREKCLSRFHIYTANIINEIDCYKIKESIILGCIPLTVNYGVFKETEGIKYDVNHLDSKSMQQCALLILKLLKDDNKLEEIKNDIRNNLIFHTLDEYCNIFYDNII